MLILGLTIYSMENHSGSQNVTTPPFLPQGVPLVLVSRFPLIKFRDIVDVSLLYECVADIGTIRYFLTKTQCAV